MTRTLINRLRSSPQQDIMAPRAENDKDRLEKERERASRLLEEVEDLTKDLDRYRQASKNIASLIPTDFLRNLESKSTLERLRKELGHDRPMLKKVETLVTELRENIFKQELVEQSEVSAQAAVGTEGFSASEMQQRYLELIGEFMVQVCGQLSLYWAGAVRQGANELTAKIRKELNEDVYFQYLDDLYALFALLRSEIDRDIKLHMEMVKSITMQLLQFENEFLAGIEEGELKGRQAGEEEFQKRVQEDVSQIEMSFRLNLNLEQVQDRVNKRIEAIRKAFAEKRKQEVIRSEELSKKLEKVQNQLDATRSRVEQMEVQSKKAEEEARTFRLRAMIDPLTKAYNRGAIDKLLNSMAGNTKSPVGLILFDIDHFKQINDRHGHKTGDRVLLSVVSIVREQIRKTDFLGRLGGDEFVVVLRDIPRDMATQAAWNVLQSVGGSPFKLYKDSDVLVQVTLSLGMAFLRPDDTAESFLDRADKALYKAKEDGRNTLRTEDDL